MAENEVILFEPDGYVLDGPKLMGRQAAGNAFLRAAVAGRGSGPMRCMTPSKASAEIFARLIKTLDAEATAEWVLPGRLDQLNAAGTLYVPGPTIGPASSLRLRAGPAAYSIVGITHTTASHGAMDSLAGLVTDPLMPWDALICTSSAVLETVRTVVAAERDYLAWRLGHRGAPPEPKLPVIPLGVHTADFTFSDAERRAARAALNIAADEVVALFVGRLSYHAKAHPHAMYLGLERAAKASGKKLALVQCGWFANEPIASAFKEGAAKYAPSVKAIFTDGKSEAARRQSWAAADLFISLSDNVQETFGLTPIEAMAAGLPSIVTDWDGYKDTVRDGEDGFRIRTLMPEPGHGARFAGAHEAGEATYDHYCGLVCRTVSVDLDQLTQQIVEVVSDASLRQRLGHQARQRARAEFDWGQIYKCYRRLYDELAERRAAARRDGSDVRLPASPAARSSRLDPYFPFAHYPTQSIGAASVISSAPGATVEAYRALAADPLFNFVASALPGEALVAALLAALAQGPAPVSTLVEAAKAPLTPVVLALSVLAKMGLVTIEPAA